ncbi:oligopeptide transport system ATP-binding protein [Entomoplasma freundtii]|uniref:Oligopeptide ABC transporter ATP-binding protein n=1 Tax=Entomoplasma freundtii TaxID=74700 RepID=A0A2K8NRX5_9MOLU|nr:ATP-binding cassette domain-containing protein [Entomoplasma freundtii]ATZ16559.1 oligopeptide ABC transporter ATP-binding protein [Entomoplasma freundtii]TDY58275.1 oligopeptide transport system ATP-binding protein [Entomoplasma freundtii]
MSQSQKNGLQNQHDTELARDITLKVRDLVIEFGSGKKKVKAVKGVTFDVYRGETFGLVGESGSGKTTIGRAVMGIQPVNKGAVYFNERLIYGEAPDLHKINLKLLRHLQTMVKNQSTTTNCLNDYLNEFKRVFYKYTQSKYYDFKTRELRAYPDGQSRLIAEGTNLKDTKLIRSKKDANLTIVTEAIRDNLKHLLKIIRLENKALKFSTAISNFTTVSLTLETEINESQKKVLGLIQQVKDLENEIYIIVDLMNDIRQQVLSGKHKSVIQYFEVMGRHLEQVIANHKSISPLLETALEEQIVALYLVAPIKQKQPFANEIKQRLTRAKHFKETENLENKRYEKVLETGKEDFVSQIKATETFKDPTKEETRELKKKMQMIFQDPGSSLNDRMAIEGIIAEGLDNFPELYKNPETCQTYLDWYNDNHNAEHQLTLDKVQPKDVKHFLILQLLTTIGMLPEHLSRYPHEFSGGQRQRIGIARALVMRPSFIVADEPISALDVSIRAQVMNLLAKFQKEFDLTYIFIAHDLSIVKFVANRIAVIYRGDIVELAEANELFDNPLHPYTKSLLSAIPLPDPKLEKAKIPFKYQPEIEHQDYLIDFPEWVEVGPNHYVYGNQREVKKYRQILASKIRKDQHEKVS